MNSTKIASAVAILVALAAPLASQPALAADEGATATQTRMVTMFDKNKDGMINKQEFMAEMERRWNMMDKQNKGMLAPRDAMTLLDNTNKFWIPH